ncbi:PREDICTED: uncharacterized protein LOC105454446 isoform X2 [Wasmannia auropunctata]|uniref:uncharacterized protein LOC105454446 isoform X2 n=1 Tax=Wasmannia auropunctata TaxID=64793 RepID=UPI0005EDF3F7|nr:PREDICTED: uncharacterized protein LOC105454446 isoform X2 [Wasmannia auropunctata]
MRVPSTNVRGLPPSYHPSTARGWIGVTRSRISRAVHRVENLKWDENDHPAARTQDAVAAAVLDRNVGMGVCKDIGNFTSALENLELETKDHPGFRTNDMQTDYFNDSEQEETVPVFKTREKSTFQLVVQGPEILIFQGIRHSPADIAPYWKKDSRMWLWKSVRLARRLKRIKAKAAPGSALYREDFS